MPGPNGISSRAAKKRKLQNSTNLSGGSKVGRRQGLHTCKYCSRDISQAIRIRCISCPSFQLCVHCFCVGVELRPHKTDHPYQVHGDLSFPLYDIQWGADEEMLLLEGIDNNGLGNWAAVSKYVGSKTAAECKEHYFEIYTRSPGFPLPQANASMAGRDPLQAAQDQQEALLDAHNDAVLSGKPLQEDTQEPTGPAEAPDAGSGPSSDTGNVGALRPSGVGDNAQVDQGSGALEQVPSMQPAGSISSKGVGPFMAPPKKVRPGKESGATVGALGPKADSVDQQQLSTRGLPTARPVPSSSGQIAAAGGLPGQQSSELQKVEGFQPEISGFHAKRFEFDHEYDNDAELLISEIEFLPTDTSEEQQEKLQLVEIYNQRLTEREHRRASVISRGLMDVRRQQAVERRQTPMERELHSKLRVFARYQSMAEHEQFVTGLLLEQRLRIRLEELKELRAAGIRTFEEADEYEADKRRQQGDGSKGLEWPHSHLSRPAAEESPGGHQGLSGLMALQESFGRTREPSRLRTNSSLGAAATPSGSRDGLSASAHLAAWRSRRGLALDITAFDGADSLSSKERHLCATERLLPHQYLAYKASFLREAEREGPAFTRSKAKYMFRLRSPLAVKIYDFMVACNWISAPQAAASGDQAGSDAAYLSDNAAAASPAHSGSRGEEAVK